MHTNFTDAYIQNFSLHKVGNKLSEEGIFLSNQSIIVDTELKDLLTNYFVGSFKSNEFFQFFHETDLKYNEVYGFISEIFEAQNIEAQNDNNDDNNDHNNRQTDKNNTLHKQSINLAKHLYEKSIHPKIKGGEFYTVYFNDCIVDGQTVDAIGLFKSENKDTFLKVYPSKESFTIESLQGVNINKLDKACIIFNLEKENGYIVSIVDNTNKGAEAQYWIDDFLHIKQRQDEYFNTENILALCKNFVTKELPQQFDITKADQADLLNKSVKFFKENESFNMAEFTNEVIEQPEVIESFNHFRSNYQQERDIEIADNFDISESAVKKQARSFKSIIKLDKNFHIYVHGDRNMIENGEDDKGKFYKVYYKNEA